METYSDTVMTEEYQIYQDTTFNRCVLLLDNNDYRSCVFNDCQLVYRGSSLAGLGGCNLNGVRFTLDGEALNTIRFLISVGQIKNGGKELVSQFLECVRAGVVPDATVTRPQGVSLQ